MTTIGKFTNIVDTYRRIYPLVPLAFVALIFVVDDGVLYKVFTLFMVCSLTAFFIDREFLLKIFKSTIFWVFFGFSTYMLVRELFAPGMSWDIFPRELRSWVKVSVFILSIAYVSRQVAIMNRLFCILIAAALIGSVVIFYDHFVHLSDYSMSPGYQIGHNSHFFWHTFFGGAFAIVVLFCLYFLILPGRRHLFVPISLAAIYCTVLVFISQSRGAMLSLFLGICCLMVIFKKRFIVPFLAFLALVAILVVIGKVFLYDPSTLLTRKDSGRLALWGHAITQVSDSPLFGGGLSAKYVYDLYGTKVIKPHNLPLTVALAGGYIGMLSFLLIFLSSFRVAYLRRNSPTGAIVATLLLFSFSFHLFDSMRIFYRPTIDWILLWLPIGLAIGLECGYGAKGFDTLTPSTSHLEGAAT